MLDCRCILSLCTLLKLTFILGWKMYAEQQFNAEVRLLIKVLYYNKNF